MTVAGNPQSSGIRRPELTLSAKLRFEVTIETSVWRALRVRPTTRHDFGAEATSSVGHCGAGFPSQHSHMVFSLSFPTIT